MVPEWTKGAIFYQIFPDRFNNGDRENDIRTGEYDYPPAGPVRFVPDWDEGTEAFDVHRFYGGDLEGVWDKFEHIKSLGVKAILFNPIFTSPSNHKYDTGNYFEIDPHLTSKHARNQEGEGELSPNEYFAYFMKAAHENGLKVVLDGVFNHCGSTCQWTKDPEKEDYFVHKEDGSRLCWWDVKTLPKLNYKSSRLREEIIKIGKFWVSPPFNCDGWRLDVGADLGSSPEENHSFWREFRMAVGAANPEAFVFAEHYGSGMEWMALSEWDSIMNYEGFMEPVSSFFTGIDKHAKNPDEAGLSNAEAFKKRLLSGLKHFPADCALSALNQLDNHDHARYITRTAGRCGTLATAGAEAAGEGVRYDVLLQSVVFQMTWPGCPGIYYGDETGICGWTDPDNRRTYPWESENYYLLDFYKNIGALHNSSPAFKTGETKILYAENGVFVFMRTEGKELFLIAINRSEKECEVSPDIPWPIFGRTAERVLETGQKEGDYGLPGAFFNVGRKEECPRLLKLGPVSSMVIKFVNG